MQGHYESAARKVAHHARADGLFARVLASHPRRAIERAYWLSPAEKHAFLAATYGRAPHAGPPARARDPEHERVTGKVAYHARSDALFGRALARDRSKAIDRAYFLSHEEKQMYLRHGPRPTRPPVTLEQISAFAKLHEHVIRAPSVRDALKTRGSAALEEIPALSVTDRRVLGDFAETYGTLEAHGILAKAERQLRSFAEHAKVRPPPRRNAHSDAFRPLLKDGRREALLREAVGKLARKAHSDDAFKRQLAARPQRTIQGASVLLTEDERAAFRQTPPTATTLLLERHGVKVGPKRGWPVRRHPSPFDYVGTENLVWTGTTERVQQATGDVDVTQLGANGGWISATGPLAPAYGYYPVEPAGFPWGPSAPIDWTTQTCLVGLLYNVYGADRAASFPNSFGATTFLFSDPIGTYNANGKASSPANYAFFDAIAIGIWAPEYDPGRPLFIYFYEADSPATDFAQQPNFDLFGGGNKAYTLLPYMGMAWTNPLTGQPYVNVRDFGGGSFPYSGVTYGGTDYVCFQLAEGNRTASVLAKFNQGVASVLANQDDAFTPITTVALGSNLSSVAPGSNAWLQTAFCAYDPSSFPDNSGLPLAPGDGKYILLFGSGAYRGEDVAITLMAVPAASSNPWGPYAPYPEPVFVTQDGMAPTLEPPFIQAGGDIGGPCAWSDTGTCTYSGGVYAPMIVQQLTEQSFLEVEPGLTNFSVYFMMASDVPYHSVLMRADFNWLAPVEGGTGGQPGIGGGGGPAPPTRPPNTKLW